nr:MAG TPA: AT hook containing protein [Caudoviricetes sp.]
MRDKLIIEKIKNAICILDDIDDMIRTQSIELQKVDYKLSDLYHLIENNELSDEASINVVKEIHDLRKERRSLNNEHDLELAYQNQKSKMIGNDSRQFIMTEINKTNKRLNSEYKNRVYTEEEIEKLISPKKKRGRPRKEQ